MSGARLLLAALLLSGGAAAFLISNNASGGRFVYEVVPVDRRPVNLLVDTEAIAGVGDPRAVTQDLMNQWNAVPEALDLFGLASSGGPYNGFTVGSSFGVFTDTQAEVAFDADGEILRFFGVSRSVLGITLKSVDVSSGRLLDVLVVINTQAGSLVAPGSGATTEELFRATLIHELGHALGIGHTAVGMSNINTFGLDVAPPSRMPSMFPFRLPDQPQEGGTIERDDEAALVRSYPRDTSGVGSISGDVRALSGAPVNAIAVRAFGPGVNGPEHVGVLTNEDGTEEGRFRITGLPPGSYRVILEAINGRASVGPGTLAGAGSGLGAVVFALAADEYWQPGDTYDPAMDAPTASVQVQVRPGRDTGSVRFVLNGEPILNGQSLPRTLGGDDSRVPDAAGGFHFGDYYLFAATAGQSVTITATSGVLTPQLTLLRPGDLAIEAEALPLAGGSTTIARALGQTGVYTLVVAARATTGSLGGSGAYTLSLSGAGGALPAPAAVTAASIALGPSAPGAQQFSSPVCALPLLPLRLTAPSHEELWVDSLTLRAEGSASDAVDVAGLFLVEDRNGNGRIDRGEPEIARGMFAVNNGTILFDSLDLEIDGGARVDLLIGCDVTVTSVSSMPAAAWVALPFAAIALFLGVRRRRGVPLLLLCACALLPLSCGGGGSSCNGAFNPDGAIVTLTIRIDPGGVVAFTSAGDPALPLTTPAFVSGTLSVSN